MLTTLKNAFKMKELRKKILYTLGMLVVIRLGSQLPVPGVDRNYFANWFASMTGDAFNFFDAFTGGSFENMSLFALNITPYITSSIIIQLLTIAIPKLEDMQKDGEEGAFTGGSFENMSLFALNITPYITSSIIIQLLTIAIPKLEDMQKDGEEGRKKLTAITRYVTVALALIQSSAMAIGFGRSGLLEEYNALNVITVIFALTAGSAFLMWVGERITENGVGNGISIVLVINIISRVPQDMSSLFNQFVKGKPIAAAVVAVVVILAVIIAMVILVIILNDATRKIPVQYAKKMQGRRMVGGQSSNIPLKVNTAGVIPVIFASSIMQFPVIIAQLAGYKGTGFWSHVLKVLSSNEWCKPSAPVYSIGLLLYIVLVIFFAYFYTSITFNPLEIANNMKKQGGFIPGIRPGKPTTGRLYPRYQAR